MIAVLVLLVIGFVWLRSRNTDKGTGDNMDAGLVSNPNPAFDRWGAMAATPSILDTGLILNSSHACMSKLCIALLTPRDVKNNALYYRTTVKTACLGYTNGNDMTSNLCSLRALVLTFFSYLVFFLCFLYRPARCRDIAATAALRRSEQSPPSAFGSSRRPHHNPHVQRQHRGARPKTPQNPPTPQTKHLCRFTHRQQYRPWIPVLIGW